MRGDPGRSVAAKADSRRFAYAGLAAGLVAVSVAAGLAGADIGTAWLALLYLCSCVLVGLAQQTLP